MTGREGMVGADGPGGLRPEPGGEHPFVKPLAGVAERRFRGLGLAGGKTVARNGKIVDAGAGHREVLQWGAAVGMSPQRTTPAHCRHLPSRPTVRMSCAPKTPQAAPEGTEVR